MKKTVLFTILLTLVTGFSCGNNAGNAQSNEIPDKSEVLSFIRTINDRWQETRPQHGDAFWHRAVYHTGNMAAYEVTGEERYRQYSEEWSEHNQWMGAKSRDKSEWKYSYGESDQYVLFGDWQTCFQVYIDLYLLDPQEHKISRAKEVMEYEMSTPNNDYWWWADGLYMVMPVMTRLHKVTSNPQYLDKLYEYFAFARDLMYDGDSKLFYRDAKYVYPKHKTPSGEKDFWARGNGWVFAAIPRILDDLPADDPHRGEYINIYKDMAEAIADSQMEEGHWTRSMLDPEFAPGFETSGTAFFTYGFLWGINNGILDEATYLPVVKKSWNYLTKIAMQDDGRIGYAQPIGERAIPGQIVNKNSGADFGVGAVLLAASEMVKYVDVK